MRHYPVNNFLRPPLEWWSAVTSSTLAILFIAKPSLILALPVRYGIIGALLALALIRFLQGYQVKRYQCYLKWLPYYAITSKQIPLSNKKLFLGKGFRWSAIHTQRLYYCQQPAAQIYLRQGSIYRFARFIELAWEKKPIVRHIAKWFSQPSLFNPVRPLPPVGGNPVLHGVEPNEAAIWLNLAERVGHTLVLGTTRVGKTRLLELLVAQDIRRGEVVIVFDPKGDVDLLRRIVYEATSCGRESDVILFHLGFPDVSARYNPVGHFARVTEVANRLANQLPGSGESAAFKEFAWRFVNIIAKALVALGRKPDYQQIQRYILNIDLLLLDYAKWCLPKIDANWESAVSTIEEAIDERQLPIHLRTRPKHLIAIVKYIQKANFYDAVAEGLCSA
ncbi:MAG TPA: conjugative transfer system coupling protein TraD, partial [Gammaproteobacteria bacterium]|nr:conjugative transfer system coupling protein TraD [Gammaproteobacteria bacterium]